MPDSMTAILPETAALALRGAARTQIHSLRRKRPHATGTDLNARDIAHLEAFVREVDAVYPPLSEEEREVIRDLRHGRGPITEVYPLVIESLAARGRIVWHESETGSEPNTTWPAPRSAWLALK